LADRLYIPIEYVNYKVQNNLANLFTHEIERYISPGFCSACNVEHAYEPPCEEGENCPYKVKKLFMYEKEIFKGKKTIAIWRGYLPLIDRLFGKDFSIKDRRATPAATQGPIKFNKDFELYTYQKEAICKWAGSGFGGMINAPARSGKTLLGAYITARLGLKTLILCHQSELVDQFYVTFKDFTDGTIVSKFKPKPRVIRAKGGNIVDLVEQDIDVILSTYQTFLSAKGQQRLEAVRESFGLLIIDEAHLVGADKFSKAVTKFNSFLKLGLTATPDRKDGRDVLAKYATGPVVSHVTPPQLVGKSYMMSTNISPGQWSHWPTLISRLVKSKTRNKMIVATALKDLKRGRNIIMLTDRRRHAEVLVDRLKKEGAKKVFLYYAGLPNAKAILKKAREGKTNVLVATRKKAQFGLDIPPLDTYYCLTPINNAPNFYQEFSRIRTPYENKYDPLVRVFVDKAGACKGCAKTCEKVLREQGFSIGYGRATLGKTKRTSKTDDSGYTRSPMWDKFSILPE
jgi:superfamily II DNA or RNA helicase